VAHNLPKSYKQYNCKHATVTPKNEIKTVNQIKKKLTDTETIVTEADKGSSMIIIYENEYNNKFQQALHDLTKKLQSNIRAAVNECKEVIPKEDKWKYISLNPTTPRMRGLIKIHKTESP
jgi:hypothetical protein